MRGKLTVEKAASNMSVFFKAIKIVGNTLYGKISREDFGINMGEFISNPAVKSDGSENRTPWNKSKFPRYFGFMDKIEIDQVQFLKLTKRGERLYELIYDQGEDFHYDVRYCIPSNVINKVSDLFWESILFDSFGRNNSGAEDSFTDLDPVKTIIASLLKLETASHQELCFIIYGMNGGVESNTHIFDSLDEAIEIVIRNRKNNLYDYSTHFVNWGKDNIVKDFKILKILSDQNVGVLNESNNVYQIKYLYSALIGEQSKQNYFLPYYTAANEMIICNESGTENNSWIRNIRLGGILDDNIFIYNGGFSDIPLRNINNIIGQFERALLKAFENPSSNIYLLTLNVNKNTLEKLFIDIIKLFDRIENFLDANNGCSKEILPLNADLTKFIRNKSKKAKAEIDRHMGLFFPANLHLIFNIN